MAEHMAEPERTIDILGICDEWKPLKGGLSAFNRELLINLAKESQGKVNVHCYVSESDEADREDAKKNGVNLVTAQKIPGTANPHEWLKFPPPEIPNVDVVIGHGRKFGLPAYFMKTFIPCKLLQFVHVYCPDLGKYKTSKRTANCLRPDTIDENEGKHADEKELCEVADAVVAVGPALQQKYQRDLSDIDVQVFTPCISASFLVNQPPRWQVQGAEGLKDFICLVCGRADFEDRELKGYDIIADAIGSLGKNYQLKFVGSRACKQRKLEKWFLKNTNITREQLTICRFVDQSQLKKLFCSSDVVVLPSRVEGFGLVALEAISADTNVLVSKQAGISEALQKVEGANCVIVESYDDPNDWANKIRHLSNQKVQERREKAICLRENYAKTYSSQEECQKLLSLIETLVNRGDISQPSQSNMSPTQMPPQQNRKRARAEVDDQIRSFPMLVQALLFQDFNEIFGKRTKIGSRCLRWGDVSLHRDQETGSERLILKGGDSRAYGGQGEHPLQPRAVKCYKIFEVKRPSEAKKPDSSFYLAVKPKVKNEDPVWYMNKPQAVNKIGKCQITNNKSAKRPRL